MTDNPKLGRWQRAKQRATQWCLWLARKCCEVIVFIVDSVEALVETAKDVAKAAVEVGIEVVQRARENTVVQMIIKGYELVKKFWDAKEVPATVKRVASCVWSFATGKACSSITAPSWAASSGWCTLYSAGYVVLIAACGIFALYMIGLLSTVFRS